MHQVPGIRDKVMSRHVGTSGPKSRKALVDSEVDQREGQDLGHIVVKIRILTNIEGTKMISAEVTMSLRYDWIEYNMVVICNVKT